MSFEIIEPEGFPRPSGFSYAIAVSAQKILYIAGQTAQDASGRIVAAGDVGRQFEQVMQNIMKILQAAKAGPGQVVKMTIYVTSVAEYRENSKRIGSVYQQYFGKHYPAMTLVEVRNLYDKEALIEIEAVAVTQ